MLGFIVGTSMRSCGMRIKGVDDWNQSRVWAYLRMHSIHATYGIYDLQDLLSHGQTAVEGQQCNGEARPHFNNKRVAWQISGGYSLASSTFQVRSFSHSFFMWRLLDEFNTKQKLWIQIRAYVPTSRFWEDSPEHLGGCNDSGKSYAKYKHVVMDWVIRQIKN